jgi:hypothetical protein
MGDELPRPASVARHFRFSFALHVVGRPDSAETPRLDGPRHCGQSAVASTARRMKKEEMGKRKEEMELLRALRTSQRSMAGEGVQSL